MDPVLGQPHIPGPLLLCHQLFMSVLIRFPYYCLHSSLSCSSPSQSPLHPSHSGCSSRSLNREQASLPSAPISLSSSSLETHTNSRSSCAGFVGVLSQPPSVCNTGPSISEPGSRVPGHRRKVEDGICQSLLFLQGEPVILVFPQPSVGALDHL